ncbi:MAG: EamA family transporter [Clostridia bacterium]|nr:EamA family transporter [Clostridia bacterium]
MLNYLLLAVTIVSSVFACAVARNDFSKKCTSHAGDLYAFNTASAFLSLATLAIISLFKKELCVPGAYTVWMGAAYGLATAVFTLLNMMALQTGPLSYTNTIVFCAMVIPALSGMVLYGEPVTAGQYGGVALMLLSFVFAMDKKNDTRAMSFRWLALCLGAFLFNGAVGVLQKVHQNSPQKGQLGMFLLIAFAVYAVFSAVLTLIYLRVKKAPLTALRPELRRKSVVCVLMSGVGIGVCNQINTYLAGAMDSIVFFPLVNGVAIFITLIIGLVVWKEKFTKKQWIGLIAGALSIVLLCGLF